MKENGEERGERDSSERERRGESRVEREWSGLSVRVEK